MDVRSGTMSPRKERFMAEQAPRVGDQAAEYGWRLRTIRNLFWVPIVVTLVAIVVPKWAYSSLVVTYTVLWCVVLVAFLWTAHQHNAAATRTLGVRVTGIAEHTPPRVSPSYEQWCTSNGLTPYAASDRYGHRQRVPT